MTFAPKMYAFCYWRSGVHLLLPTPPVPRGGSTFSVMPLPDTSYDKYLADVLYGCRTSCSYVTERDIATIIRQRKEFNLSF